MGRYTRAQRDRYTGLRGGRWGTIKRGRWAALLLDQNSGKVEPVGTWLRRGEGPDVKFRVSTYGSEQSALQAASRKASEGQTIGAATVKKGQTVGVLEL